MKTSLSVSGYLGGPVLARESLPGVMSFPPGWQVARRRESLLLRWLSPAPGCSFTSVAVDVEQDELDLLAAELAVALWPHRSQIDPEPLEQLVEVLRADAHVVPENREGNFPW